MKLSNKNKGDLGEVIAANYLLSLGYSIIDKNFRCQSGEIDIIARDKNSLCFIEVKTRNSMKYGRPCEAVNYFKKMKIYKTSRMYIARHSLYNCNFRFDIVEVLLGHGKNKYNINLIKNAFQI